MTNIKWQDFQKLELKVGTIVSAKNYSEAKKPAYILEIDLGEDLGIRKSSAQITKHYSPENLVGKQVVCVTNLGDKQIGKIISQVLVTGFPDEHGNVVLCTPDKQIMNGAKLF